MLSQLILHLKRGMTHEDVFCMPIYTEHGELIGSLKVINQFLARQHEVIDSLTRWRKLYMRYFLTQFSATPERTEKWLKNIVLPSEDRILFLIGDSSQKLIGNFGVCNIGWHDAELDNLIRGEKGGHVKLIFYAELAILYWLFFVVGVEEALLHVFSNNQKTIQLHSEVGFTLSSTARLSKVISGNDIVYKINAESGEMIDFGYNEMILSREIFIKKYPWIAPIYRSMETKLNPVV